MPEMGMEAAPDEVAHLFEAYRREHVTSSLTLPQFRQIYAMRQQQKVARDVSHIKTDAASMHKTPDQAAQDAAAETRAGDARKVAMKLHTQRKAAQLMAKLHERVPEEDQQRLMGWCKGALKDHPPTLSVPDLGNNVMGLCEQHLRDSESGLEIECDLRDLFAELLEIPLDSFNEQTGGIPRRLFALMLSRYRKKNAKIASECAIPEDEEEEEGGGVSGVRYRGTSSACEDLRPAPNEAAYLRRLEMMEKIPKDKLEKFLNPTRAGVF